jgi:hypothetical protein
MTRVVVDLKAAAEELLLATLLGARAENGALAAAADANADADAPQGQAAQQGRPHQRAPRLPRRLPRGNGRITGFGSKIDAVVLALRRLKRCDPSTKSLVFSQWGDALALLREALTVNSVASLVLSGGASAVATLKRFRESTDADAALDDSGGAGSAGGSGGVQVLLMPLKATNAGLSINEATHVFLLDTGLHRGLETQALARVRRVNSTTPTTVHRIVMQGTVEEAMWDLLRPGHDAAVLAARAEAAVAGGKAAAGAGAAAGGEGLERGEGGAESEAASPHVVRRSDVHAMFQRLERLYQGRGPGKGLGPRPEWRSQIYRTLETCR